jgi:F-type H+-transporting ATPase subunit b
MSFDWATFAFQLVNILILLAILQRFLFRPIAGIIAKRQAETADALAHTDAIREAAEAAAQAARDDRDALAAHRAALLEKAGKEAEAARAAVLKKARAEAAALLEEARAEAGMIRAEGEKAALDRARSLAMTIAERLLADLPEDARVAGYADRLAAAIEAMSGQARDRLLAGGVRLITPRALTEVEAAAVRAALAPLGFDGVAAEADPALLAGLELRGPNGAVRNSLAHDLDRIAQALGSDDQAAA